MHIITMTSKGRLTIPAEMRKRLGMKKGTRLGFVEEDGKIIVRKIDKNYFLQFAGILGMKGKALKGLMNEKAKEKYL